jgi:hypothetical protein
VASISIQTGSSSRLYHLSSLMHHSNAVVGTLLGEEGEWTEQTWRTIKTGGQSENSKDAFKIGMWKQNL